MTPLNLLVFSMSTLWAVFCFADSPHMNCAPPVASAPSCPAGGGQILDDSYPAAGASVSATQGVGFAYNFVSKVMFAQNPPVPVVVTADDTEYGQIVNRIKTSTDLTKDQKSTALKLMTRVSHTTEADNWQQDFYQTQFDRNTGLPVLHETQTYLALAV